MLSKPLLERVLLQALTTGGDFAEVFVEDKYGTNLSLVGGRLETGLSGRDYGIGIRIFKGFNYVYAYTNNDSEANLLRVAKKAADALVGTQKDIVIDLTQREIIDRHPIQLYPQTVSKQDKVALMLRAYNAAKDYSSLVSQVRINYLDEDQRVQIANSDGLLVEDQRVRTRTMINAIASKGNEKQSGSYGPGASKGFEFYDEICIEDYAREAARTAATMIEADLCPSGRFPVIIDNEFGGVIFHEACGHSLEATSVAKKTSVFADRLGERIASDVVSAVDDGTVANAWGSQNIDDEGSPTQRNLLIENGILKGYLVDKLNGRRMGMAANGSSRRQSYKYAPTSRMSNTYIMAGESTPEEIIAATEFGIFAKYMGGGSVRPATGEFNFAVREAYMVRNGQLAEPVRGATLIGKGSEILHNIDMVANNFAFGQGMCGSRSGSVPVNAGQPTIRVSEIVVGGRKGVAK